MLHYYWHLFSVSGLLPSILPKQDFTTTLHSTTVEEHGEGTIRQVEPHTTSWAWRVTMTTLWASTTRNHHWQWIFSSVEKWMYTIYLPSVRMQREMTQHKQNGLTCYEVVVNWQTPPLPSPSKVIWLPHIKERKWLASSCLKFNYT